MSRMRLLWRHRSVGELDHELIWFAVSATAMIGFGFWFVLGLPWPKCMFHAVTGLPCFMCGTTRAAIAFVHGDFLTSLHWNPLAFVVLSGLVIFDLYALFILVSRKARLRMVEWSPNEKLVGRIAIVAVLTLNWFYLLAHRSQF